MREKHAWFFNISKIIEKLDKNFDLCLKYDQSETYFFIYKVVIEVKSIEIIAYCHILLVSVGAVCFDWGSFSVFALVCFFGVAPPLFLLLCFASFISSTTHN